MSLAVGTMHMAATVRHAPIRRANAHAHRGHQVLMRMRGNWNACSRPPGGNVVGGSPSGKQPGSFLEFSLPFSTTPPSFIEIQDLNLLFS